MAKSAGDKQKQAEEEKKQRKVEEEEKKQRKKMARHEALLMLKLQDARKEVRRAEQKVSKAQAGLEGAQAALQGVEQQLAELRGTAQEGKESGEGQDQTAPVALEGADQAAPNEDSERDPGDVPSEEQIEGPPPVEGRTDIEQPASEDLPESVAEPITISSGGGSIAVESSNEHAWPPPETREEVAEAIEEESGQTESAHVEEGQQGIADEPVVIASGEGSILVESSDEHAWPPPEIREEVAESIKEEESDSSADESDVSEEEPEEEGGVNGELANGETSGSLRTRRRASRRSRTSS